MKERDREKNKGGGRGQKVWHEFNKLQQLGGLK